MGMIGEANAYYNAIKIESIILNAIDNNCNVEDFVKKELFDWYLSECEEAFMTPNTEIIKRFKL